MNQKKFSYHYLSYFLCLTIGMTVLGSVSAQSTQDRFHTDTPETIIIPSQQGFEKLAPDLQDVFRRWEAEVTISPANIGKADQPPLLVSALIQPGTDTDRFFSRSVRSRQIAGMQWVTGEIEVGQLGKLASFPGVVHVISSNTYQTAEAPGLADLRTGGPGLSIEQMRSLVKEGGPELLQQQFVEQRRQQAVGGTQVHPITPEAAGMEPSPGLLGIHDVISAHARGYTGAGVVVAVVDTGVDFSHPDLQGTHAIIQQGPYAGWPFAYDVLSGAYYAMSRENVLDPYHPWDLLGYSQYSRTQPVTKETCSAERCEADLFLVDEDNWNGELPIHVSWPNLSRSGNYLYTVHPDLLLAYASYLLFMNYREALLLPPIVIVSDEQQAGVYDAVYVDMNYNYALGDPGERLTQANPLGGADLNDDNTWDLSAGLLAWISDGIHHPPGVATLYPEVDDEAPPAAGQLLAFINDPHGHGTNCTSEIVGQGRITDPFGLGPTNPLFAGGDLVGGAGGPVIRGMAHGAKVAAMQNGFSLPLDAWTLAVLGMDGIPDSGDEAQIVSNSWGDSRTIADGWDPVSRFAQRLSQEVEETVSFLVATGNGGHGYGTTTSPGGGSIIDVGASTAYGAVLGFELVGQDQYLYGDIQPWSNRGPGALGDIAPDITAVGAWGTGAQPLNYYFGNGQAAYDIFGGTSMSTPVAAGIMALIYEAFQNQSQNQRWPTWKEARSLLLNSAHDLGYDGLTQGSGNAQAGQAIDIITGQSPGVEPQQWQAGSYRGQVYPSFPAILHPGEQSRQIFTVYNPTSQRLRGNVSAAQLRKVHEETFTLAFIPPPPQSKHSLPVFLEDISALIEGEQPDLVRAQLSFPFDRFDVEGNGSITNWWSVEFYDWMDRNQDGNLWIDNNQDGLVADDEIDIDPETGLYEYNRFSYGYPQATTAQASLGVDSLSRHHDGVFLGLSCTYCGHSVTLQVRLSFYKKVPWDWLSITRPSLNLAPGSQSSFEAQLSIPADTQPGIYDGLVEVDLGDADVTIPVISQVAAASPTFTFGDMADPDTPYRNGELFGGFNWGWRYESGDWRFFTYDFPDGTGGPGKTMVVDTRWDTPQTDLDTWVFGPAEPDPLVNSQLYGPYGIQEIAGSTDTYLYRGRFAWQTSTGTSRELVAAPVRDGLGMLALHNVLNGGVQVSETFTGRTFLFASNPAEVALRSLPDDVQAPLLTGSQAITLTSTGDIPEGIQVRAYGFSRPVHLPGQTIFQDVQQDICSSSWIYGLDQGGLEVEHAGLMEIITDSSVDRLDIDLYLFRDNGDEKWDCAREQLDAYSMNAGSAEQLKIYFPKDGLYWVAVHGYNVPEEKQPFDFTLRVLQGDGISLRNQPTGPLKANQPVTFTANFRSLYSGESPASLHGLLMVGLPADPKMLEIPVQLQPEILLYPQPMFIPASIWVRQEPVKFELSFQNQGVSMETVQVQIQIPDGLIYELGSAVGPVSPPTYDSLNRTLNWVAPVGGGEKIVLTFQARAQAGFTPGWVTVPATVAGQSSGQEWAVNTRVGVHLYGMDLPVILR